MNIVYTRITQSIDINPFSITQGQAQERIIFFQKLIERGHRLKVIAPFTKNSEKLLEDVKKRGIVKAKGFDVSWMKKIIYKPEGLPSSKDEVMIVENGPANVMFAGKHIDGLPLLRCKDAIAKFKGLLLLHQADPDLPFPLYKYTHSKYPWSHKKNAYRIETKNNAFADGKYNFKNHDCLESHGWGDYDDFFDGSKTVVLLSKSMCPSVIAKAYNGPRNRYDYLEEKGLITIEGLPTVHSELYYRGFNKNPKYDVLYQGYPRNREKDFIKYFCDMPRRLSMVTTGPWNEKKIKQSLYSSNQTWLGYLVGLREVDAVAHDTRCTLQLGVPRAKKLQFVTGRHFESVFSGSVVFYDHEFNVMERYLGSDFALHDKEDAARKYVMISKMSNDKRYLLWRYQYELCKKYTYDWYMLKFEKLCEKYGFGTCTEKYKKQKNKEIDPKDVMKIVSKSRKVDLSKYRTAKNRIQQQET